MHAVAHQALNRIHPAGLPMFLREIYQWIIRAIQENTLTKFRARYQVDYLLIDDIHLGRKERIQEEFFHTFNEIYEARPNFPTRSPSWRNWQIESRLLSRFQWGLVTDIQAPDLETRVAILTVKRMPWDNYRAGKLEFWQKIFPEMGQKNGRCLTRVAGCVGLTRKKADLDTSRDCSEIFCEKRI